MTLKLLNTKWRFHSVNGVGLALMYVPYVQVQSIRKLFDHYTTYFQRYIYLVQPQCKVRRVLRRLTNCFRRHISKSCISSPSPGMIAESADPDQEYLIGADGFGEMGRKEGEAVLAGKK